VYIKLFCVECNVQVTVFDAHYSASGEQLEYTAWLLEP